MTLDLWTYANTILSNECPAKRMSIDSVDPSFKGAGGGAGNPQLQRRSSSGNVVALYRVGPLGLKGIRSTARASELVISHSTVNGPVEADGLVPSDCAGGSKRDQRDERYHPKSLVSSLLPSFGFPTTHPQSHWNRRGGRGT